ncbi:MAG: hypothetical protein PHY29_04930 [Syntrophales bacterium]|nr:hypothetical protein [Syntrophales bacterium]
MTAACEKHSRSVCNNAFDEERAEFINDNASEFLENNSRFDIITHHSTMHPKADIETDRDFFLDNLFRKTGEGLTHPK